MKKKKLSPILSALLASALIITATVLTVVASSLLTGEIRPNTYEEGVPQPPETMRAFTVLTGKNGSFPTAPNLSAKHQRQQLAELLRFAETYGFNTIFFEAVPEGDAFYRSALLPTSSYWMGKQGSFAFFDPLQYLTDEAKSRGIRIYALVDPFSIGSEPSKNAPATQHPDWITAQGYLNPAESGVQQLLRDVTKELTGNYDIAGVVVHEIEDSRFDAISNYTELLSENISAMHSGLQSREQQLGIVTSSLELAAQPLKQKKLDLVVVSGLSDPLTETEQLNAQLSDWAALCKTSDALYYPQHSVNDETAPLHLVDNSGYLEKQYQSAGVVVESYATLNTEARIAAVSLAASFRQKAVDPPMDLQFGKTFLITSPIEPITVGYDWNTYYITGTSDPAQPATFDGEDLTRSPGGLWGIQVPLSYGENTFTFSQGDASQSVAITRPDPTSASAISDITKSSPYPTAPEAVLAGENLRLSCVAPAGGTVTASIGGLTATLEPVSSAQKGTAVTYQANLDVSSLAIAGQVRGIGTVNYQLLYDGMNSYRESAGTVYLAGSGASPVVKVNSFAGMVNRNPKNDGDYLTILRKDCVDTITANIGDFYQLSSGGYILKTAVDLPEGQVSAQNMVSKIALQQTPKGEKLVVTGDRRPAYVGSIEKNVLTITLYNTSGWETMNPGALKSTLCESIGSKTNAEDGSVTLTFQLLDSNTLLGWDVSFEGEEMSIYLRKRPSVDMRSNAPLANVTVVLDPGHGGNDPGALGVPGSAGPAENILNLANSYAIRSRLEALGATVYLCHENTTMSLNERLEFAQKMDADIFIASHHNSVAKTTDASDVSGIEVYYWNNASQRFAQQIGDNLASEMGRKLRSVEQSFYRVTMMTGCPAVLVESGFICAPVEYEQIADPFAMFRYGNAVADAVLAYYLPTADIEPTTQSTTQSIAQPTET